MPCAPRLNVDGHQNISVGKIICLARTYRGHAEEMGSMPADDIIMFLKPASAVIHDGQAIRTPQGSTEVHHEVEMAVVIGHQGSHIPAAEAASHIHGYAVALDITARDIQREAKQHGHPWAMAKGYDTFCPISRVTPAARVSDPHALDLSLSVNGEQRQSSTTGMLLYTVEDIVAAVSEVMTLCPGDLILTGTPEGVGPLHRGDIVEAHLGDCCHLKVTVK
ncbi:MAG: fumarylacetoacetate hydrolase family protein [Thermoplasmatota archaeon]